MTRKAVLLLQGGGALGAFQCGAWKAVAPFLRENGYELALVAGASIGAINGALIARCRDEPDGGAGMLEDFWRHRLATPAVPFFPIAGEYWRAWNGLLTGLLLGNGALFTPVYQHWNPVGDAFRFHMPLYQTRNCERTMAEMIREYRGTAPVLCVAATDVASGNAHVFDSTASAVTPEMFAASIAIPMLFPPIEINGRLYWDGEMRSNTLLPEVLARLPRSPLRDAPDDLLVIVVDMFRSAAEQFPSSAVESQYRFMNVLLGGKLHYDRLAVESGNAALDAMQRLHALAAQEGGSPLATAIDEEYMKLLAHHPARIEVLHIGREQFRYEHISRDFDYSPPYIAALIEQGFENASSAVREFREKTRTESVRSERRQDGRPRHVRLVRGNEQFKG